MEGKGERTRLFLIISLALNVGLATGMLSLWRMATPSAPPIVSKKKMHLSASFQQTLSQMEALPFHQLASMLRDRTPTSEGYTHADIALALLDGIHQIDLARALGRLPGEQCPLSLEGQAIFLFPQITPGDMNAIALFLKQERWPFRPEKLFTLLKEGAPLSEKSSLIDTFRHFNPFLKLERLFHALYPTFPTEEVLALVLEGSFEDLEASAELMQQNVGTDGQCLSRILLSYALRGSGRGFYLALQIEPDRLAATLSHEEARFLVERASIPTDYLERFLRHLLTGPRPSELKEAVRAKMTQLWPHLVDDFVKQTFLKVDVEVAARTHRIERGDTIWKIAKKYKVAIGQIMRGWRNW